MLIINITYITVKVKHENNDQYYEFKFYIYDVFGNLLIKTSDKRGQKNNFDNFKWFIQNRNGIQVDYINGEFMYKETADDPEYLILSFEKNGSKKQITMKDINPDLLLF